MKKSQGRKKIEIKKIEQLNNRQVTFSKRRVGLFKKTSELCILTGAQAAIIVHSPGGRVYAFGHPTVDGVIDRFLNTTTAMNNASDGSSNEQKAEVVKEFNEHYSVVSKELDMEKKRRDVIQESKAINGGELGWYGESVDGLGVEELEEYLSALVELKRKVLVRADELAMIKKAPAMLNDIPIMENPTAAAGYGGFGHTHGRDRVMM